jgi:hypothetical protein
MAQQQHKSRTTTMPMMIIFRLLLWGWGALLRGWSMLYLLGVSELIA